MDKIYKEFAPVIYRYALFKLGKRELADDVTSECFVRFMAGNTNVQNTKAWLIAIARNVINEKYRELIRERELDSNFEEVESVDNIEETAVSSELLELVKSVVPELDASSREVISLHLWEQMSFAEISEVTKEKESTVKLRFYRGIDKIKKLLNQKSVLSISLICSALALIKADKAYAMPSTLLFNKPIMTSLTKATAIKLAVAGVLAVATVASVSLWAVNLSTSNNSIASRPIVTSSPTKADAVTSSPVEPTIGPKAGWTTYVNNELGFKISYPADLYEVKIEPETSITIKSLNAINDRSAAEIMILSGKTLEEFYTLQPPLFTGDNPSRVPYLNTKNDRLSVKQYLYGDGTANCPGDKDNYYMNTAYPKPGLLISANEVDLKFCETVFKTSNESLNQVLDIISTFELI